MKSDTESLILYGAILLGGIFIFRLLNTQLIGAAFSVDSIITPLCKDERGGYHCYTGKNFTIDSKSAIVKQITDTITITKDNGNKIPKNSWMVYVFEIENEDHGIQAELDLVPDARDGTTLFIAVYQEVSVYNFKIPPVAGHRYQRTMMIDMGKKTVTYILKDLNTGKQEQFSFKATNMTNGRPTMFSQGIEHWNFASKSLFPDRYDVVTTQPVIS